MKKLYYAIISLLLCFLSVSFLKPDVVYAASASVYIDSASVTKGRTVEIDITISADAEIEGYQYAVYYDSDMLEWIDTGNDDISGGGGRLSIVVYDAGGSTSVTQTFQFKGLSVGTTYVSIEPDDPTGLEVYDTNLDEVSVSSPSAGSITIQAPPVASGNCNLESLVVYSVYEDGETEITSLSPSFSPSETVYEAQVSGEVSYYAIDAITEHSAASVDISGQTLTEGENTTTIRVTAENGTEKLYSIITTKEKKKPIDNSMLEVVIDGKTYVISRDFDNQLLSNGFESTTMTYADQKIKCAKNGNKTITLLHLVEKGTENGSFWIYDVANSSFQPFTQLSTSQKYFIVLKGDESFVPEGFAKTKVTIGNNTYEMWQDRTYYMFYAQNQSGVKNWYLYESTEGTVQVYTKDIFEKLEQGDVVVRPEQPTETKPEATPTDWYELYRQERDQRELEKKISILMVAIFGGLAILCLAVLVAVLIRQRKQNLAEVEDAVNAETENLVDIVLGEAKVSKDSDDDIDRFLEEVDRNLEASNELDLEADLVIDEILSEDDDTLAETRQVSGSNPEEGK